MISYVVYRMSYIVKKKEREKNREKIEDSVERLA